MKRTIVLTLILQFITTAAMGQSASNRYEVELLMNPNAGKKDTREVNAVLIFEKDGIKIQSRRSKEIFKEFRYADIRSAEHSYSREVPFRMSNGMMALSVLSGMPLFMLATREKEKHWLMVATDDGYAVLKIENDNYRLIRMEFIVKKIDIVDIDEDR
ncbi:MAG: hypothetical protein ABJB34_10500 [Acidobacteriota bacterium]